jgi:hypothetical protein
MRIFAAKVLSLFCGPNAHAPHSMPHRSFERNTKPGTRPEGSAFIVLTDSWRKIAISHIDPYFGEQTAQAGENA